MDVSLWILLALTVAAALFALIRDAQLPVAGLYASARLVRSVWIELLLGFLLAGLFDVLVPAPTLLRWLGPQNPTRSILIAWLVGLLIPGGPYVFFPIVASLFARGAAPGALITLITAKTLISPIRMLTYEAPLIGWPLTLARLIPGLFAPPLLGVVGQWLFRLLGGARP